MIDKKNNRDFNFSRGMKELETLVGQSHLQIEFLAGDGSDRTYHRLLTSSGNSHGVLMKVTDKDNHKIIQGNYDWCLINAILKKNGLLVPTVIGKIPEINAMVIEDFGDRMLEKIFQDQSEKTITKYYKQACNTIVDMLYIKPISQTEIWTSRSFDATKFKFELNFFIEHFLQNNSNLTLKSQEKEQLQSDIDCLSEFLAQFSTYFTHRDFHSRNIIIYDGRIGIIDFQDARLGPPSYDVSSLLFDPYVTWDYDNRIGVYDYFISKIPCEKIKKEIEVSIKPMALQRIIKAIGSFGYLTKNRKRGNYLKYVPNAVHLLDKLDLEDSRWPFISKNLITKLRKLK